MSKKTRKPSERGQAIILIAAAIVGLVAIVGLMVDGGILLIEYARLKRGIDSASIAAASQFRKPLSGTAGEDMGAAMENAGREFLRFNQSDADVSIFTCSYPGTSHDAALCAAANNGVWRKLVRVSASRRVDFGFMRIVGINSTTIAATSVGEAASIDMVLMIDTSASMAYETKDGGNPLYSDPADGTNYATDDQGDNPDACNDFMNDANRRCEPLGKVKDAAVSFVDELFYPYDQVALVTTTSQTEGGNRIATDVPAGVSFMDNFTDAGVENSEIQDTIRGLRVFQPVPCHNAAAATNLGGCLNFDNNSDGVLEPYQGLRCIPLDEDENPTTCGSSNIGGGIYKAAEQFLNARQDSFWVVIALIGGPANATNPVEGHLNGLCPGSVGNPTWDWGGNGSGYCRWRDGPSDGEADRHYFTINDSDPDNPIIVYPSNYDPDDYARDAADYLASPNQVGATVFSICMGSYCKTYPSPDPFSAEHLGQYMALTAGDELTALPPVTANHGEYYYAENPEDLAGDNGVFAKIADNIFTRISK